MKKALLLVDIQNDFVPGGALAAPEGDKIIPLVNRLQPLFQHVLATQDWHPADHGSFAAQHAGRSPGEVIDLHGIRQILWPVHCVQQTHGAAFADGLETRRIEHIFHKGADPRVDSYSAFFDNGRKHSTGLEKYLREHGLTDIYIAGLATDYCIKYSALDAAQLGFNTHVIADACRAVNMQPGDDARAFDEMSKAGVRVIESAELASR
ncbi:bifunctional nicotinamidase/pyrazinamidase [Ereboglobus luteus]|uniref:Nicotinamidase n=1 Tax=Ereboglobus luteus TaxID=1796921 RepID=A0A2U8E118_9BACT|nr:bifunctional nicotinamidase/pyrazinamidase [Ereboglobus luteus]AWI08547.1 nicotinamidase [Ereboglobus luteus]